MNTPNRTSNAQRNGPLGLRKVADRVGKQRFAGGWHALPRQTHTILSSKTSPQMKKTINTVYKFLRRNVLQIAKAQHYRAEVGGVLLEKKWTGSVEGLNHTALLKATLTFGGAKKSFFIKIHGKPSTRVVEGMNQMERILKQQNHQIGGMSVRTIKPIIVHDAKKVYKGSIWPMSFFVSKFFGEEDVMLVNDLKSHEKKRRALHTLDLLDQVIAREIHIQTNHIERRELFAINAFFNEKTNTLYLFDYS